MIKEVDEEEVKMMSWRWGLNRLKMAPCLLYVVLHVPGVTPNKA